MFYSPATVFLTEYDKLSPDDMATIDKMKMTEKVEDILTLVQLNLDMPCLCKQCRSRSVVKNPTDLNLHCLSLRM